MEHRKTYDVVVVGAGPAGSSAAYELARQGVSVALVDKAPMPRYKTCGGGIVSRALKLVPFDISEAIERECRIAELNLADAGLRFLVERSHPLVSMTMRENFDYLLFRAAANAGAHTIDGCRVLDVAPHNGKMEVTTDRDSLLCRFVVGADGGQSIVAKKGGWRDRLKLTPLVEWEVSVKEELFDTFSASARFEFGPVPAGYAWIFPKKKHLSIGLGGFGSAKVNLKALLRQFLDAEGIGDADKIEQHGYYLPVNVRQEGFVKDRILLTGDAAGFVDPVTGEGITYALLSGQGAARALLEGDFRSDAVKDAYTSEISERVLRELRWGKLLGALLYKSARIRTYLFTQYGKQLTEAFADVITGEMTYASLCRKHVGLRRFFKLVKGLGGWQ
jgi:geranylgeranyl reductase family protein